MIKVVIVEDEPKTRATLRRMLELMEKNLEVIGEAGTISTAKKVIEETKPDVLLLDIQLPDGKGFDLLEQFENRFFSVVFITAHEEYAIKAFKFSAADYLLKPIDPDELERAIGLVIDERENKLADMKLTALLNNMKSLSLQEKRIVLKTAESIHIIPVKEVIRCESDVNYTSFHLTNHKKIMVSKPLKEYDEMLHDFGFLRSHQSHLINLSQLMKYDKTDGGQAIMSDGSSVPVSTRKREELFNYLDTL